MEIISLLGLSKFFYFEKFLSDNWWDERDDLIIKLLTKIILYG